jgi:hypothetical protein
MNKPNEARLGAFLREVSNWRWSEFVVAENDMKYTSNQAMIFALIRSCAMQNLQAIRLSINRLDGKLATPLKIEYPKIFYLYPNAKPHELPEEKPMKIIDVVPEEMNTLIVQETPIEEDDLPSLSIRQTVAKMSDYSRELPQQVAGHADRAIHQKTGQYAGGRPAGEVCGRGSPAYHGAEPQHRRAR